MLANRCVGDVLTVGVSLGAFVAEVIIVCISVLANRRVGNVLAILICLVAFIALAVVVLIAVLADGGIGNILTVGVGFAAVIAEIVIIGISMPADIFAAARRYRKQEGEDQDHRQNFSLHIVSPKMTFFGYFHYTFAHPFGKHKATIAQKIEKVKSGSFFDAFLEIFCHVFLKKCIYAYLTAYSA
jgi:hypothetical protein